MYTFVGKSFPKVYHISYISHRNRALSLHALAYGRNQFVEIIMKLVYPTLVVAFLCSQRIYLSHYAHHASYVASLRLCARHATKTRRYEEHTVNILTFALGLKLLATSVEHGNSSAMHDTLRTNIHIRASRHLTILAYSESIHALPVVGLGIVRYHHSVSHHHSWSILMRREQAERMTGIHHQRLLVGHLAKIFHRLSILCPVLEYRTITTIYYKLVRMLRNLRV